MKSQNLVKKQMQDAGKIDNPDVKTKYKYNTL